MKPLATVAVALASFAGGVVLTVLVLPRWTAFQSTQNQATVDQKATSTICWLNQVKQRCTVIAVGSNGAFKISFSAGDKPFFVFTPVGPPTTDNRPMRDDQGRLWLYSGNSSFTLTEQGGFNNVISVEST